VLRRRAQPGRDPRQGGGQGQRPLGKPGWVGNWKPPGQPLSWAADGRTLAFQAWDGHRVTPSVLLLDTAAPGTSLAAGRLVRSFPLRGTGMLLQPGGNTIITPDGSAVAVPMAQLVSQPPLVVRGAIEEFSTRTGQLVRSLGLDQVTLAPNTSAWTTVYWSSPSGRTLVIRDLRGRATVVTGTTATPLPGFPASAVNVAW
jgi:hypothetical protein